MKENNFILIHGYTGRSTKNRIPWLKYELDRQGYFVDCPNLPFPDDVKIDDKVEYVLENCDINENTIIVGHSLGAIIGMKVLERLERTIFGYISVCGAFKLANTEEQRNSKKFRNYIDFINNGGEIYNWDFQKIKKNIRSCVFLQAKNDTVVSRKEQENIANKLDADIFKFKGFRDHASGDWELEIFKTCENIISLL